MDHHHHGTSPIHARGVSVALTNAPISSSVTTRSHSLQNFAMSLRQRGNSELSSTTMTSTTEPSQPLPIASSGTGRTNTEQTSVTERYNSYVGSALTHPSVTQTLTAMMPDPTLYSIVLVYDVSSLMPVSKALAGKYRLIGTHGEGMAELARWNLRCAKHEGRKDLVTTWRLIEQCISYSAETKWGSGRFPWATGHPFGRELINNL